MGCTEDWKISCTMTGHPVWDKVLRFFLGVFFWFFHPVRWKLESLFVTKCVNLWLWYCLGAAGGAIDGWGDAVTLLQLSNLWAKLPDTLPAWVVRGGSERGKHLLVYCTEMIPPSPKGLLGHSDWHRSSIFQYQWLRCGELIVQQTLCCSGEISWGFADGQWL